MKKFATRAVDWQCLRSAFGAAAEALVSAIPLDLTPIEVSLSDERSLSVRLRDSPMVRAAIACNEWFSEDEGEAGIIRIWALLALLPHIPKPLLFELDENDEMTDDTPIRDEVFMVAASIPMKRDGRLPRERLLDSVRTLIEARRNIAGRDT